MTMTSPSNHHTNGGAERLCAVVGKDAMTTSFTIMEKLPQANKFRHLHWAAKKQVVDKWRILVCVSAAQIKPFDCAVDIKVIQICGKGDRCYDRTNLLHVVDKLIIDGLVKMDVIVNDTPKWLDVSTDYERGALSGVRIEITEKGTAK